MAERDGEQGMEGESGVQQRRWAGGNVTDQEDKLETDPCLPPGCGRKAWKEEMGELRLVLGS